MTSENKETPKRESRYKKINDERQIKVTGRAAFEKEMQMIGGQSLQYDFALTSPGLTSHEKVIIMFLYSAARPDSLHISDMATELNMSFMEMKIALKRLEAYKVINYTTNSIENVNEMNLLDTEDWEIKR